MRLAVASVDRAVAGNLLFGLIVGLLVTVSAHAPAPQLYCPPLPSITTQSAMLKVKKADNACTIADGGYVKTNTSYRLHIAVEITGDCGTSKSECSGLPVVCSCVPSITYIRTLQQSYLRVNGTLRGSVAANPSNDPTIQNYDTETSTNTTSAGASWLTLSEGQFLYTSLTNALATPCNLEPTQFPHDQPVTMHAMACKPEWFTGGSPTVNFHGPPTGTVTIVVPSAAFEDARGPRSKPRPTGQPRSGERSLFCPDTTPARRRIHFAYRLKMIRVRSLATQSVARRSALHRMTRQLAYGRDPLASGLNQSGWVVMPTTCDEP